MESAVVYKYIINPHPSDYPKMMLIETAIPMGWQFICIRVAKDFTPVMYALVNPNAKRNTIKLMIIGTGIKFPPGIGPVRYLDTYELGNGEYIGHVFQVL